MMSQQVIAFHYKLTDVSGKILDQSETGEPLAFMTGVGQIIPGLESVLVTMKTGDKKRVEVEAKDAYGERDLANIINVKRSQLPEGDLKVGDMFHGPNGDVVTVTAINGDSVTLDANHPLAGQKLVFDVEIATVRQATVEEVAHGHAHGADGHHHH
jgi:FKBP-type peptidyl-prolyl cis-trans isomerase SlyD